jgi:hypothetical protein
MKLSRLAQSIALTFAVMSLGVSFTALSANNATKISGTMSSVYNSKFDEADMIALKLSDIRVATMAYWTANQAWPTSLNDIITNSFYFSSFNTTTGYSVSGGEGTNSYFLQLNVDNVEVGKYLANKVNGTYSAGTMTLQYALPVASIQNSVSLARYDDPADVDASTMYTELDMGGNDILNVKSIVAEGDLTITSLLGTNSLLLSETAFQMNGDDIITSGNLFDYFNPGVFTDGALKLVQDMSGGVFTMSMGPDDDSSALQSVFEAGVTGSDYYSQLNFSGSKRLTTTSNGVEVSVGNASVMTINSDELTYNGGVASDVDIRAGLSKFELGADAVFLSDTGDTYIGMDPLGDDGLSFTVNVGAADSFNLRVGPDETSGFALRGLLDGSYNAYASLQYESSERLRTAAGGIVVAGSTTWNTLAGVEYANINDISFTYMGADVITADNIAAYAPTNADTLDGIDSTQFARLDQANEFTANINLQDNVRMNFGNSNDLSIYHDGTNSLMTNNTGNLDITSPNATTISVLDGSKKTLLKAQDDVLQLLFGSSNPRLETTLEGIRVFGEGHFDESIVIDNTLRLRGSYTSAGCCFEIATGSISVSLPESETGGQTLISQVARGDSGQMSIRTSYNNKSAAIVTESSASTRLIRLESNGGSFELTSDQTNGDKSSMVLKVDEILFQGDKSQAFPIAMNFTDNTFKVNGFDVITVDNISSYVSTDADTLDGIDSTQFARLDQVNTFSDRVNLEDGATIKGAISLVNSSAVEYASITDTGITFNGANVWATSAQLSVAGISTGTINATSVTADTVTADITLAVNGVDVGQWIANCEAGTSPGCSL